MMKPQHEVIIIGGGPAGISAGIQLKRFGISPLLIERDCIGGLLRNANLVENYPGFPDGIRGMDLVRLMEDHVYLSHIHVSHERVENLLYKDGTFLVRSNTRAHTARFCIIASGTKPKKPEGVIIEASLADSIFYEIYPVLDVELKKIAIIGAGDAAFDYALNLGQQNEVVILNRSERISSIPLLQERCRRASTITYIPNIHVERIDKDTNLILSCIRTEGDQREQIVADYVIFAIGREPNLDFLDPPFKKQFDTLIEEHKLFVIGDVKNKLHRQTAIAAGDGIRAAMEINDILNREQHEDQGTNRR